jgi:hypothetical protein
MNNEGAHRLTMAIWSLHLTAIVDVLFGLGLGALGILGFTFAREPVPLDERLAMALFLGAGLFFLVLLTASAEIVAWGIRRRRRWSWVAGIVVLVFHATSFFYWPMVGFGLWGLLDGGSQRELRRLRTGEQRTGGQREGVVATG